MSLRGLCLVVYLLVAVVYAHYLLPHGYESQYLTLGPPALRGEISLYADELTGQWMPAPFWIYGATQLFGPSLRAARGAAIVMGAGVIWLTFSIAESLGGKWAGVIACALVICHGMVMGYLVTAHFAPLVSLLVLGSVRLMVAR